MARFEVKTPVAFFRGEVVGVLFAEGRAVVTSDTDAGLRALYYFRQQGYGIAGLDGVEIDEVLARANEDPASEHARLTREISEKESRLELDDLRRRNKDLDAKVFKADAADRPQGDDTQAGEGATTQPPLQAPPPDDANVTAWRKWAVDSGRATKEEVKDMDRAAIQAQHGSAYDRERAARLQLDAQSETVTP